MRDYLAWRLAFGVTTPSTNTVVQPEYDDMRPPGVTNHLARMVIPDMPVRCNEDFDELVRLIDLSLEDAVDRAMDCQAQRLHSRHLRAVDLGRHAAVGRGPEAPHPQGRQESTFRSRSLPTPSSRPQAPWRQEEDRGDGALLSNHRAAHASGVLGPHGYEIVRFNHMRGKNPTSYSVLTARDMIEAIKSIDGADIEAIVQFGANLPMAKLADEAERWLDKPVISVNVATYWHACRMNGIDDKLYGFTQLFSRF